MPTDRVPYYLNEQYVSADQTTVQRIFENALEELAGFSLRTHELGAMGANPSLEFQPDAVVLGGLAAGTDGAAGLTIDPGLLVSTGFTSTDNPSASTGYLGLNAAQATVPIPSPVSDTWYLVGARPKLTNAAAVARNVFDPPNGRPLSPTPNLVKRQHAALEFLVVLVGTDLAGLGGALPIDAVPLWAVFRPAGGGAIVPETDLVDLRPAPALKRPIAGSNLVHNHWRYTDGLKLDVRVQLDEVELYAGNPSFGHPTVDPMLFANPNDSAPAAGQWWYLYLARYRPLGTLCCPRHAQRQLPGMRQQGLLIFSKVAPYAGAEQDTLNARRNSAALRAPAPYSAADIAAGDAYCFGALRRNPAGNAWMFCQCSGDHVSIPNKEANAGQAIANLTATLLTGAPPMARTIDLMLGSTDTPSIGSTLRISGATPLNASTAIYQTFNNTLPATAGPCSMDLAELPVAETGLTLTFAGLPTGGVAAWVRGYRF